MSDKFHSRPWAGAAALAVAALTPIAAFAQDAAEAAASVVDKGDTAWMMVSTLLVLFMIIPGLALFYGGLVRAKNMLSVLMQCTLVASVVMIIWVLWGYSFAFGGSTSPYWGGIGKVFLSGVNMDSTVATFTDGVVLPEYVFICFQMTFAAITPALIVGAFAERAKFTGVVLFTVLWVTFVYFPIAHMVWDGAGLIFNWGAIDFAGGTVVHINAGIAGLVWAILLGKRIGYGRDNMAPHSMTLTMVGAAMLWVGWFGFNAGSNLEATANATLAMMNTFIATAAAVVSWSIVEGMIRGKASGLGAASGMVAGLVAVTPACGTSGPIGALFLGLAVSPICYFFVSTVKSRFGYDDSLDVFGVHGVGGIVGAVGTGILLAPSLGGTGGEDFVMASQVWIQIKAVLLTIVWSGIGSFVILYITKIIVGIRAAEEDEREGLDLASHGESAYHS
ncbi:ammonium transporter [Pseudohoeflea suaedae]|uniref:Ammonium transporter n=1 Tax=Pseudohoeflea suaedae TaxID=877384 RepID=A0A4R5PLE7_9HYPH|nr:ammonium transporter [Pseudohoeflea suaedae]TDH37760.1 ammonium transporter [Pseudohoeflea suaedae]